MIQVEASTFEEVVKEQVWKDAMAKEYKSIMKNDVWDIMSRPKGRSVVTSKWLYKIKHGADGSIEKYKARFVACGFSQKEGEDYDDIFAPMARYTTIRSIVALTEIQGWTLHQMDVKIAFLHGLLQEMYVEQPPGFEVYDRKTHVCRLKKAPYGLKQAPRSWYACIYSYLMKLGFTRSNVDPNLYFKTIQECKRKLASKFEMKDLGLMHYFLGLEVWQKLGEIFLSQEKYVVKLLKRFGLVKCNSLPTTMELNFKKLCGEVVGSDLANPSEYKQLVGALMFLVNTGPDICFAINTLNQFMTEPHHVHWVTAKHVLRYLHGTINLGMRYDFGNIRLHGYIDTNWAANVVDRKSTFGCYFNMGSAMVSWMSWKQKSVALSTAKAMYIAASLAICEAIWLRKLFRELFEQVLDTIVIYCDNKSGIRLSKNHVFHDKSKHIEIRYHFIRDIVQRGVMRLLHISINAQIADILTKALPKRNFLVFRE
eukprot:PITA_32236